MMVVLPFTVRMPMLQLFRRCLPYGDDFDFKRERHTGQGVVAVDHHLIAINLRNMHMKRVTVLISGL